MKTLLVLFCFVALHVSAQDPSAYEWFTGAGKHASFDKMLKPVLDADIVLFGELHDDPIAHWMQLLIAQRMVEAGGSNVLFGAEMFERDQQQAIDRFLSGQWTDQTLQDSTKMWSNFGTDYLPLLIYAKEKHIPFIATNIPRPYASKVFRKGLGSLDSLSATEKQWICPLPFVVDTTLSQYRDLVKMGKDMHGNGLNFAYAQAIKDATMAYSILQHWTAGKQFLHLNGSYHSDFHQGIGWYLHQANPNLKIVTISTVTQDQLKNLDSEYKGRADFILVVPTGMTRTM